MEEEATENEHRTRSETEMKKKNKKKKRKREDEKPKNSPTVSIAVPGSIIDNAQSLELATLLAGQIARAATIFRIDEVVVFDSRPGDSEINSGSEHDSGAQFLVRILEYLETPQYLRRSLFPWHSSLKYVGLLPPLDAPHHVRKHEWLQFREGVTLEGNPTSKGTLIDVGLTKNVVVEEVLEPGLRVTVAMGSDRNIDTDCLRKVVRRCSPREEKGLYWGYEVRYASSISSVIKNCPYEGGYDHVIGTSEHGVVINASDLTIPTFRHLLIAFGGLAGLEESIEEDSSLKGKHAQDVFDSYLNTCPLQGSRTIRTEEAIFISLQYFQEPVKRAVEQIEGK